MRFKEIITEQMIDAINEFHQAVKRLNELLPKTANKSSMGKINITQDLISLIDQGRRDLDHSTQKMIDAMMYFARIK